MASSQVAQAELLADVFEAMLTQYVPRSVAVLGCAGGNGFERISPAVTDRVVGVDLNPSYVEKAGARFRGRFATLHLLVGDIQTDAITFEPVDMLYAALLFEYVEVAAVLKKLRALLKRGGVLGTVVQLPSPSTPMVTPSPFVSLAALSSFMHTVSPSRLRALAEDNGFEEIASNLATSPPGKHFHVQVFRLHGAC
ncbi:MAG: class I SAM-dependent methyltransferase [Candidatus Binatia bacterium]